MNKVNSIIPVTKTSIPTNVPREFKYIGTAQYVGEDKTVEHPTIIQHERFVGFIEKKITTSNQNDKVVETIHKYPQYIIIETKAECVYQHTIYELPCHPEEKNKYTAEISLITMDKKSVDKDTIKAIHMEISDQQYGFVLPQNISDYSATLWRLHFFTGEVQLPWYLIKPESKLKLHVYQKYGTAVTDANHPIIKFDSDYVANPLQVIESVEVPLYFTRNTAKQNKVTITNGVMCIYYKYPIIHVRDREFQEQIVTRTIGKV